MGNDETKAAPQEAGAGEGRGMVLVGRGGMDHTRPAEPDADARGLEHPVIVRYPIADGGGPAVGERGCREVRAVANPNARADRECEWREVQGA